jgi:hypothetical protein
MPRTATAKTLPRDALRTVADALDSAVKSVGDSAAAPKAPAAKLLPATGRFLSRLVYGASYTLSYGIVFPTVLIAKSIPSSNVVVHGFVHGAEAASEAVVEMKSCRRQLPSKSNRVQLKAIRARRANAH